MDFYPFFWEFVVDCGGDRRLPEQAKKKGEIAGRENILIAPANPGRLRYRETSSPFSAVGRLDCRQSPRRAPFHSSAAGKAIIIDGIGVLKFNSQGKIQSGREFFDLAEISAQLQG